MKAAVIKKAGHIQVENVATPVPGVGEVRVAVRLGGICGSDNSMFHGKLPAPFPLIPGHEAIGTVESMGEKVSGFKVGQRVTVHPNYFCGECDLCKQGLTNICRSKIRLGVDINGVFADFVVVPAKALYPVPDSLADEVAVLVEPLAVSLHGVKQAHIASKDNVLIFGAGVVGQLALQLALQYTAKVTNCDLIASRLELARKMGAQRVISDQDELASCQNTFDVVFETSGAPSGLEQCINLAAPGGKIVLLGLPGQSHPVSTVPIVRKELTIKGSMIYTTEIPESLELLAKGVINTQALVSNVIELEDLQAALEGFSSPQRMKTLVKIG